MGNRVVRHLINKMTPHSKVGVVYSIINEYSNCQKMIASKLLKLTVDTDILKEIDYQFTGIEEMNTVDITGNPLVSYFLSIMDQLLSLICNILYLLI
jgi:hypothetical protein